MQHGVAPLHTADEMRELSNMAHLFEGLILGIAALVALHAATLRWRGDDSSRSRAAKLLWPSLITAAGLFLLGYLVIPHHGLENARVQYTFILEDPQQRRHVWLALLAVFGGGAELIGTVSPTAPRMLAHVWPVTVAVAGISFLAHTQHGSDPAVERAMMIHRYIGIAFLLTALLRATHGLQARRLSRQPRRHRQVTHRVRCCPSRGRSRWRLQPRLY
jgi:hypothetical protein